MNILLIYYVFLSLPFVLAIKLPLSTFGKNIVDLDGNNVHLHCINWSGGHMQQFLTFGLEYQSVEYLANLIKRGGFNCVKLQFSTEMVFLNKVIDPNLLKPNPNLIGKTAIEVYKFIVDKLTDMQIMIILDYHTLDSIWCCEVFNDENGLWYNERWSVEVVLEQLLKMIDLFKYNKYVIGVDVRNEIRPNIKTFNIKGKKYIKSIQYPNWGITENLKSDWHFTAEWYGNEIHKINSDILIIVQGIFVLNIEEIIKLISGNRPNFPQILRGAINKPIKLNVNNKVVYSAHCYPWNYNVNWDTVSYDEFVKRTEYNWGFEKPGDFEAGPLFIGEIGTQHDLNGISGRYWQYITRYIKEKKFGFGYWELAGNEDRITGSTNSYGLLNRNYTDYAYLPLLESLQKIMN
jgi:hypothetical protein